MVKIDFGIETKKNTNEINKILYGTTTPVTLTDILDNIHSITNMFVANKITTIGDLIKHVSDISLNYVDELAIVRTVNLIVNIANDPELSTDYSYLVDMLRVEKKSYYDLGYNEETTTFILPLEKPKDINTPILNVLLTLVNVLGYKQTIIVVNEVINYGMEVN